MMHQLLKISPRKNNLKQPFFSTLAKTWKFLVRLSAPFYQVSNIRVLWKKKGKKKEEMKWSLYLYEFNSFVSMYFWTVFFFCDMVIGEISWMWNIYYYVFWDIRVWHFLFEMFARSFIYFPLMESIKYADYM